MVEGEQSRPMVAPGSALLQDLLDHAPPDHFTLEWGAAGLQRQSVGAVVFLFFLAGRMLSVALIAGGYLEDDGLIAVIGVSAASSSFWASTLHPCVISRRA